MDCFNTMRGDRAELFKTRANAPRKTLSRVAVSLLAVSLSSALLLGADSVAKGSDDKEPIQPLLLFSTDAYAEQDENAQTDELVATDDALDVEAPRQEKAAEPLRARIAKRYAEKLAEEEKSRQAELYDPADSQPTLPKATENEEKKTSNAVVATTEEQPALAANQPQENAQEICKDEEDDEIVLFPNLRPFKRARARLLAMQNQAPEPPEVEQIQPENAVVVSAAKPPILTLENDSLPPLESEVAINPELATKYDLDSIRAEMKDYAWRKGDLKITPYGFLNLAVSSDTQRAVPGEYILYLQDPAVDSSADFAVDARTSRLGLKIEGPRIEALNATLGGVAEFDFQGVVSGSKNKGGVQLRRAYAELVDAQHERRFLAGQDWEIISPGAAQMLNYLPGAFAGNIQYRRAQVRFEQGWTCSQDLHFLGQIGIFDDVLGDYASTAGVTPMSAGWPVIEGRIAMALFKESRCGLPITVGVSGHIGEQYYKFSPVAGSGLATTTERKEVKTWSANLDLDVPITKKFKLLGEYYQGTNLSSFCGGINQGVDLYRRESIDDRGWWASAHYDWTDKLATNVGYGNDKPKGSDLVGTTVASGGIATARTKNEIYFVNAIYNWTSHFMTGLEVSYWETGYQKADVSGSTATITSRDTATAVRTEFVTRLSF